MNALSLYNHISNLAEAYQTAGDITDHASRLRTAWQEGDKSLARKSALAALKGIASFACSYKSLMQSVSQFLPYAVTCLPKPPVAPAAQLLQALKHGMKIGILASQLDQITHIKFEPSDFCVQERTRCSLTLETLRTLAQRSSLNPQATILPYITQLIEDAQTCAPLALIIEPYAQAVLQKISSSYLPKQEILDLSKHFEDATQSSALYLQLSEFRNTYLKISPKAQSALCAQSLQYNQQVDLLMDKRKKAQLSQTASCLGKQFTQELEPQINRLLSALLSSDPWCRYEAQQTALSLISQINTQLEKASLHRFFAAGLSTLSFLLAIASLFSGCPPLIILFIRLVTQHLKTFHLAVKQEMMNTRGWSLDWGDVAYGYLRKSVNTSWPVQLASYLKQRPIQIIP